MRDYPHMQKNYARARELMARSGNPTQWGDTFPKDDVVRDDIAQRRAMLLVDEVGGHERILAQFALCPGEDPTYHHIDGAWLDDDSYVTIHRIASSGLVKHAARDCIVERTRSEFRPRLELTASSLGEDAVLLGAGALVQLNELGVA